MSRLRLEPTFPRDLTALLCVCGVAGVRCSVHNQLNGMGNYKTLSRRWMAHHHHHHGLFLERTSRTFRNSIQRQECQGEPMKVPPKSVRKGRRGDGALEMVINGHIILHPQVCTCFDGTKANPQTHGDRLWRPSTSPPDNDTLTQTVLMGRIYPFREKCRPYYHRQESIVIRPLTAA